MGGQRRAVCPPALWASPSCPPPTQGWAGRVGLETIPLRGLAARIQITAPRSPSGT